MEEFGFLFHFRSAEAALSNSDCWRQCQDNNVDHHNICWLGNRKIIPQSLEELFRTTIFYILYHCIPIQNPTKVSL